MFNAGKSRACVSSISPEPRFNKFDAPIDAVHKQQFVGSFARRRAEVARVNLPVFDFLTDICRGRDSALAANSHHISLSTACNNINRLAVLGPDATFELLKLESTHARQLSDAHEQNSHLLHRQKEIPAWIERARRANDDPVAGLLIPATPQPPQQDYRTAPAFWNTSNNLCHEVQNQFRQSDDAIAASASGAAFADYSQQGAFDNTHLLYAAPDFNSPEVFAPQAAFEPPGFSAYLGNFDASWTHTRQDALQSHDEMCEQALSVEDVLFDAYPHSPLQDPFHSEFNPVSQDGFAGFVHVGDVLGDNASPPVLNLNAQVLSAPLLGGDSVQDFSLRPPAPPYLVELAHDDLFSAPRFEDSTLLYSELQMPQENIAADNLGRTPSNASTTSIDADASCADDTSPALFESPPYASYSRLLRNNDAQATFAPPTAPGGLSESPQPNMASAPKNELHDESPVQSPDANHKKKRARGPDSVATQIDFEQDPSFDSDVDAEPANQTLGTKATPEQRHYFARFARAHFAHVPAHAANHISSLIAICEGSPHARAENEFGVMASTNATRLRRLGHIGPKALFRFIINSKSLTKISKKRRYVET